VNNRLLLAAVGLAVLVAGCAGEPTHSRDRQSQISGRHFLQDVRLGRSVGPPQIAGDVIVFPAPDGTGDDWTLVRSVNLKSGARAVLARTAFRHGMINWVVRVDDWTVYVDQSAVQSDADPDVLWRVRAIRDGSAQAVQLDTSGNVPSSDVPTVRTEGTGVLWSSWNAHGSRRLLRWNPGLATPEPLRGNAPMDLAPTSTSRAKLVGESDGDCWSSKSDGTQSTQLTRSGRVLDCEADQRWLTWRERADPRDEDADLQRKDDPYEIWAQRDGAKPFLVHRGYMPATYSYLTDDTILYVDSQSRYVLQDLEHRSHRHRFPPYFDLYDPFGDGDRIGFVTESETSTMDTVHVIDLGAGWNN
jgi:hypothetical protein